MDDFYPLEEDADTCVEYLQESIDIEKGYVKAEHDFKEKIMSFDAIHAHLSFIIDEDHELHDFFVEIERAIRAIREPVISEQIADIRILGEEKQKIAELKADIEHREWRAVVAIESKEEKEQENMVRLHEQALRYMHQGLKDLEKLMRKELKQVMHQVSDDKKKFAKQEQYYLLQIYKFVRAYEKIFRHLLKKERILNKKQKT